MASESAQDSAESCIIENLSAAGQNWCTVCKVSLTRSAQQTAMHVNSPKHCKKAGRAVASTSATSPQTRTERNRDKRHRKADRIRQREADERGRKAKEAQRRQEDATPAAFPAAGATREERTRFTRELVGDERGSSCSYRLLCALEDPLKTLPLLQLDYLVSGSSWSSPDETVLMLVLPRLSNLHANTRNHLVRSIRRDGYDVSILASSYCPQESRSVAYHDPRGDGPRFRQETCSGSEVPATTIFEYIMRHTNGEYRNCFLQTLLDQPACSPELLNVGKGRLLGAMSSNRKVEDTATAVCESLVLLHAHGMDLTHLDPLRHRHDPVTLETNVRWLLWAVTNEQVKLLTDYADQSIADVPYPMPAAPDALSLIRDEVQNNLVVWSRARAAADEPQVSSNDASSSSPPVGLCVKPVRHDANRVLQQQLEDVLKVWEVRIFTYKLLRCFSLQSLLDAYRKDPAAVHLLEPDSDHLYYRKTLLKLLLQLPHDKLAAVSAQEATPLIEAFGQISDADHLKVNSLGLLVESTPSRYFYNEKAASPVAHSLLHELYRRLLSLPLPPQPLDALHSPFSSSSSIPSSHPQSDEELLQAHLAAVRHVPKKIASLLPSNYANNPQMEQQSVERLLMLLSTIGNEDLRLSLFLEFSVELIAGWPYQPSAEHLVWWSTSSIAKQFAPADWTYAARTKIGDALISSSTEESRENARLSTLAALDAWDAEVRIIMANRPSVCDDAWGIVLEYVCASG